MGCDVRVHVVDAVIRHGERFGETLALAVTGADADRIHVAQ